MKDGDPRAALGCEQPGAGSAPPPPGLRTRLGPAGAVPDLHLGFVVALHHLRGEVLQAQGGLQRGTHRVQVRAQRGGLRGTAQRQRPGPSPSLSPSPCPFLSPSLSPSPCPLPPPRPAQLSLPAPARPRPLPSAHSRPRPTMVTAPVRSGKAEPEVAGPLFRDARESPTRQVGGGGRFSLRAPLPPGRHKAPPLRTECSGRYAAHGGAARQGTRRQRLARAARSRETPPAISPVLVRSCQRFHIRKGRRRDGRTNGRRAPGGAEPMGSAGRGEAARGLRGPEVGERPYV